MLSSTLSRRGLSPLAWGSEFHGFYKDTHGLKFKVGGSSLGVEFS